MKHFSNIIIGFGKAGKTLAGTLAKHGEEVLVIEKDPNMYGGTCINIACLPTKNMIINAHRGIRYEAALKKKNDLTAKLRNKNYHKVADLSGVTVLTATAEFLDDHTLQVSDNCSYTENPDYFISRVESEIIKYRSFLLCQQENTHLNLNHLLLPCTTRDVLLIP